MSSSKINRKNRMMLFLLIAVFIIPLFIAWVLFKHPDALVTKTNRGIFIQPNVSISTLKIQDRKGQRITNQSLHQKWSLVLFNPSVCNKDCEKKIFYLGQIQLLTGKNRNRLQRVIISSPQSLQSLSKIAQTGTQIWLAQSETLNLQKGNIYLVDPLGNLVLRYLPNQNPMDIYKDLNRLLQVSQIG